MFTVKNVACVAPSMRKLPKRDLWEITSLWRCRIYSSDGVYFFEILPDFTTDLASVPRLLRGIMDNGSGDYGVMIACVVHDLLYTTHYLSRETADKLFRAILLHYKVDPRKAEVYYRTVRLFGQKAFDDKDERVIEIAHNLTTFYWLDK